jgi:hypothetical protein
VRPSCAAADDDDRLALREPWAVTGDVAAPPEGLAAS